MLISGLVACIPPPISIPYRRWLAGSHTLSLPSWPLPQHWTCQSPDLEMALTVVPLSPGCRAGSSGGKESTFSWESPRGMESRSGEKMECSFSPSKVSKPPAVFVVSPRKQTRSPKVSFLLPHSYVYSAPGTGLYRSGCSPANPSPFGLQPLLSYSPVDALASFRQVYFLLC